jgi:hypothetical protein
MKQLKSYPTIGVCGLDCGLCPRYYTLGPSRCPGCGGLDFDQKRPSCSFITCCVKKKNFEVCAECLEFPCSKFKSAGEYQQLEESSSYPSCRKIIPNLNFIKEHGIEEFIALQTKRIKLLETMIADFDDGRSRSFFCKAGILLDINTLSSSIDEANGKIKAGNINRDDVKMKAKMLKEMLNEMAAKEGVELLKRK